VINLSGESRGLESFQVQKNILSHIHLPLPQFKGFCESCITSTNLIDTLNVPWHPWWHGWKWVFTFHPSSWSCSLSQWKI